jgi:hypothetical protein
VVLAVGGIPGSRLRSAPGEFLPSPLEPKDRTGAIDVTVTGGADGPPFAGARVRLLAIVDDRAYVVAARDTDATGIAHLSELPRGEAWILADAPGRARASTHLVVETERRSVAMVLEREQSLDVRVNDDVGGPVADAELEVVQPGDPLPVGARAGPDGRARVGRLGPGPWRITARAPGYEEGTGRAGHDRDTVTLVLRKLGAIRVHVVSEDGLAVKDARVSVAGPMLWPPRAASTDPQGDVRIGSLEAGTYALRATKDDTVSPIDFDVALGRGDEKTAVLRLGRGRFVSVRVTDGDADDAGPIAGARVTLAEGGLSPFPLEGTSDAKGRVRIGPIAPGGATLSARADGFVPRGAVAVPDPPPLETRVALTRAGTLTGRVVDARGEPVAGATIEIAGTDLSGGPIFDDPRRANFQAAHFDAMLKGPTPLLPAGELGVVPGPVPPIPNGQGRPGSPGPAGPRADIEPWVTRADGTFRAVPASPGRVWAIVRSPEYVEVESEVVTLTAGGEAHVEVVMHRGGSLEGRILDAHDRPVEGARVIVSATVGALERMTRTATDGAFAFAALPASVSLTASADDDEQPAARLTVAVPEGGRKEVTVHLPERRKPLDVRVVDDRGFGVETAQVSASSLSVAAPFRTTVFTDGHGDASLRGARGLPLRIEARAPAHAPRVVTTEGNEDVLKIELTPAESATGEVIAARGRDAIAGAEITLYTDLGVRRARSDGQGAFVLSTLAPGGARMTVRASGFAPVTQSLVVPDSGGRRPYAIPRVELREEGIVEGDVVDARGDAVVGARVAIDHVPTWLLVGSNREPGTGTGAGRFAVTDPRGHFSLREVPEGSVALEAYAPGVGRARSASVTVVAGRTTDGVHLAIARAGDGPDGGEPVAASGGVAVTLGETAAKTGAAEEVVLVSVVEGSEAERAGLAPGDVVLVVDGAPAQNMEEARSRLTGPVADDVLVVVRRGDRTLTLRVAREAVRR